ncbi:MAG TPA: hypothetical protein VLV15_00670, partial [Dongiaceae bacterium]|nr:hypothetical protein [Dongiaceae bacterium]
TVLSSRERGRWERCRLIHYDLQSFREEVGLLKDSLAASPTLERALRSTDGAFQALRATAECDNLVSMIEAPDRWEPWQQSYEASARTFYRDWYGQLRAVHESDRGVARALNQMLPPARQFPIPPAISTSPPTIGAVH